eukprot:1147870-Pelagomonas_calceolata.AAC.1
MVKAGVTWIYSAMLCAAETSLLPVQRSERFVADEQESWIEGEKGKLKAAGAGICSQTPSCMGIPAVYLSCKSTVMPLFAHHHAGVIWSSFSRMVID